MPNTNKHTIRYKDKTYNLLTMSREELEPLRTHILLDIHDIEQQVSWAKYQERVNRGRYDRNWMRNAIKAARIKQDDVKKINDKLEGMPYTLDKTKRDIIELKRSVRAYLNNLFGYDELVQHLDELDFEYGDSYE